MVDLKPRPRVVLIASHGEWVGRSVQSVLELNGYATLRVANGRRALDLARTTSPDALILDESLPEIGGIDICRALRDDPLFDRSTPVFVTSPGPASNQVRQSAYEAGAWDFCSQPLDVETLMIKMGTYIRARRRLEDAQSMSLIDAETGLYSAYGLQQWAAALGARAARQKEPFGCAAVTPASPAVTDRWSHGSLTYLADLCRSHSRKSDIVGYVGDSRFVILVPDTDETGVRRYVDRLDRALALVAAEDAPGAEEPKPRLYAGFYVEADFSRAGCDGTEVVPRATEALRHAERSGGYRRSGALSFRELPVP